MFDSIFEDESLRDYIDDNLKDMKGTNTLTNMHAIGTDEYPKLYKSAEDIMLEWCHLRMHYYHVRKEWLVKSHKYEVKKASNKYVFVKAVIDKELELHQNDEDLEKDMVELELEKLGKSVNDEEASFDYLLSMQMRSMTVKKLEDLEKEIGKHKQALKDVKKKDAKDLWREDLDDFEKAYKKYLKCELL